MEIRKFEKGMASPIPTPGITGVTGAVIQLPKKVTDRFDLEALNQRYNGLPLLVDRSISVIALYFDEGATIHEHAATFPILFMVLEGSGFVRVGGPDAPVVAIKAGEAMLWPADVVHIAWTEDQTMQAITVEQPA